MPTENSQIQEERISLGHLINGLTDWVKFILRRWLIIGLGTVLMCAIVLAYNYLKPRVFFAKTSFVLENDSGSGLGDISSLASLAGVNLGSRIEGSPLFQIDNIQVLYGSHRMLEKTLLSDISIDGKNQKVIQRYAESHKMTAPWEKKGVLLSDFMKEREDFSRAQDSVMIEVIEIIKENQLHVAKASRKTTILEVGFRNKDENLAKAFNEIHVKNVNQFYQETVTKKASANLEVLQLQADSVKQVLDQSIENLAKIDQSIPSPNPLYKTSQVPYQKALVQVQANGAIYQEIVKQLELAKVAQRNKTPLIQIVDKPLLPLENSRWSLFKTLAIGCFVGFMVMVLFFTIKRIISTALSEVEK